MRAVSIASKLGQLGQLPEVRVELLDKLGEGSKRVSLTGTADSKDPAERYLVWSVEELFRIMLPQDVRQKALEAAASSNSEQANQKAGQFDLGSATQKGDPSQPSQAEQISLAELQLPPWVTKLDILASIESLGTFYSVHQVPEYAVPLYLQALSILLPKNGSPTVSERCKAALVMNNISQLMSVTNVEGASKWATKGLGYVEDTVAKAGFDTPSANKPRVGTVVQSSDERTQEVRQECLGVRLTLLYNLGVLSDVSIAIYHSPIRSLLTKSFSQCRWEAISVKQEFTSRRHICWPTRQASQWQKQRQLTASPNSNVEDPNPFCSYFALALCYCFQTAIANLVTCAV